MLIPVGIIVAVCTIDVLAPPDIHLGPLLVAAPTITAADRKSTRLNSSHRL